jgi:hypothetical protein
LDNFSGIGLFVFSDPGAAKAVLAQIMFIKEKLTKFVVISDREYSICKDFGIEVVISSEKAEEVIGREMPDFVFTGTSYTSKIELEYIKSANSEGIRTAAFVDHWTAIKERFEYLNSYVYPNEILVIDEKAKDVAVNSGINSNTIKIFGNPYYQYIKKWKPKCTKDELYARLGIENDNKLVVYAPDPLSNLINRNIYGFNEIEATEKINTILNELGLNINFVLKLHPNQKKEKLLNVVGNRIIVADSDIDSNVLIFYSDLVLGFFSNFLIEAFHMQKKILRLDFFSMKEDPLANTDIGIKVGEREFINELNSLYESE